MCSINGIRIATKVLAYIKAIMALYIFAAGVYLGSTFAIRQAYGNKFISYGGGLAFLGVMSGTVTYPTIQAFKKHNKFLILVCLAIDALVLFFLVTLGIEFLTVVKPVFPKDLQLDCLSYERQIYTEEECKPFLDSDRTAGFRLFWEGYYSSISNSVSFQVLSNIEADTCCGFFAPFQCVENTKKFPSSYSKDGIRSSLLQQRVTCGYQPYFYPEESNCLSYYNEAAIPPIIGGCYFDLGVSYCLTNALDSNSRGCASAVEDYVGLLVEPHGYTIIILSSFNFIMVFLCCCMWWKRKEYDVFPEFNDENTKRVDYKKVKDRFVIIPNKEILEKEGFVPTHTHVKHSHSSVKKVAISVEESISVVKEEDKADDISVLTANNNYAETVAIP